VENRLALLSALVLLTCALACQPPSSPASKPEGEPYPIELSFVPEMSSIPELDSWERCDPKDFGDHIEAVKARWKKVGPWVAKHVTPEQARALSRWARKQMDQYTAVSPMDTIEFKPVRHDKQTGRVLLEGTVDTLPVHAPLVTRWLKVFLLYECGSKTLLRATITIRGERRE